MSDPQPPTTRKRYLPTRENFILRVKELLCELATQTATVRDQPPQEDTPPPDGQKPPVTRE